jgi:AcrR family transcriptional regulator
VAESAPRPLRADARANREKILDAARTAFAADGPDVNLREIARRAGVGPGTIHRHFPTKEALFGAIIAARFQELTRMARALRTEHGPGDAFFTLVRATVEQAAHNRSLSAAFGSAEGGPEMRAAGEEMTAELGRLLDDAQGSGAVRGDVDLADVHAVLGAVVGLEGQGAVDDAVRARRVEVVLDGLRAR